VTSIGIEQSAIWIRDSRGERQLSSEGEITGPGGFRGLYSLPRFSSDATHLTYLRRDAGGSAAELWRTNIMSGRSDRLLPGIGMREYDVAADGRAVVFSRQEAGKPFELWIARLDGSMPPRRIASSGENSPHFGPSGEVLFRFTDGTVNRLGRMDQDGSGRRKLADYAVATVQTISPDRRWLVAITPPLDGSHGASSMAIPTAGGPPRRFCAEVCRHAWSPDGRFVYIEVESRSRSGSGRTIVLPVVPETGLPELPGTGFQPTAALLERASTRVVEHAEIAPGLDPGTYAFVRSSVQRNLFRVTVRDD
jgi:hypothetical protein